MMPKSILPLVLLLSLVVKADAAPAAQPQRESGGSSAAAPGEQLYRQHCAQCHDGPIPGAPQRIVFSMLGPDNVLQALTEGVMKMQADALSSVEKKLLAEHLGESELSAGKSEPLWFCSADPASETRERGEGAVPRWGATPGNTRFIDAPTAQLEKDQVSRLKLKWSFVYPNATRARSQPTVHNGAVYVGSQDGTVYALDLYTGCVRWTYRAEAEVRSSVVIGAGDGKGEGRLFFGDFRGNVYSISAKDGALQWKMSLEDHPDLTITGSPSLHDKLLYVPMSSREWATAANPGYSCCTFRGGVAAINVEDGSRVWTTYTIDKPVRTGEFNANGQARWAPSGVPVWNSPTIDVKRNRLYVGTGENYSSPATKTSDAVIAMDLTTGEIQWIYQATSGDAWNLACNLDGGTNCPKEDGPDFDIGASPILLQLANGKELVLAGQKSGVVFALDPEKNGELLWRRKIGAGGFLGGVHWGMAGYGDTLYAPIADKPMGKHSGGERNPGLFSLDANTGEINWYSRTHNRCGPDAHPACDPSLSAAITAIPGVVFAGGLDGYLRAFDSRDGSILWEYATDREFETGYGARGYGGSIESDGPLVVEGHVLINSGYSFGGQIPGNVLLAFTVEGK